jgi:ribosomal RNA-processing protein 12
MPATKAVIGNAFEDVLYGTESELEDSEDDGSIITTNRKNDVEPGARLRLDVDEPMDLLQGATSHILSRHHFFRV